MPKVMYLAQNKKIEYVISLHLRSPPNNQKKKKKKTQEEVTSCFTPRRIDA